MKLPRPTWPHALVGLSTAFGLIVLRGETRFAQPLNDSSFHMQMVRWAGGQIHRGRLPFDGWYPWLSLGSSFFHHYQSLPETLTAYTAAATGASDQTAYLWLQYLLLATWPVSVYAGARLLGWERWAAAGSAAVAPLLFSAPGYGFEWGSYIWDGIGLYGQLWAMWILPLAWGLTWRAVAHGRRYAAAALAVALTIACHFIAGYLALLAIGVWVIALGAGRVLPRLLRAGVVAGASMLVALWVLVPLIEGTTWTNSSEYFRGTHFNDSYGTHQVLSWLVRGQLFDHQRFPVILLLFAAGVAVCGWKAQRDPRARALLGVFALSLVLFCGRHTLGPVLGWLPGSADLQFQRFEMGVDLSAILIASVGVAAGVDGLRWLWERLLPRRYLAGAGAVGILLLVGILVPAWSERHDFARTSAQDIKRQRALDSSRGVAIEPLIGIAKRLGGGRVYAGLRGNWGYRYTVGGVQMYAWLADNDIDQVGFTFRVLNSLSTDVEARLSLDERNPAEYEMFGVRYFLLPDGHPPPVPARRIASSGGSSLYRVATSGYFQVVDRTAAITANRTDVEQASRAWRSSDLASRNLYPGVAFAGGAAPPPTLSVTATGEPGVVESTVEDLAGGVFTASVEMRRTAVVLLKESYDPSWTAMVDGAPVKPVMMAPSLVGVDVPQGHHVVRFRYAPYGAYPVLLAIGFLVLAGLTILPRRPDLLNFLRRGGFHRPAIGIRRRRT